MNIVKKQIKEGIKNLALRIRESKEESKAKQRLGTFSYQDSNKLICLKYEYRHRHTARCLLKGIPYERIESKVNDGNSPNFETIKKYQAEYLERLQKNEVSYEK